MWSESLSRGYETDKIKYYAVPYTRGVGLDIGCGPKRIWPSSIGLDRFTSAEGASISCDVKDLNLFSNKTMDYVYSSHVVEDFVESETFDLLLEWWRVIKVGGYLVLYLPHEDLYPKVGEPGANPEHKQNLNPDKIISVMKRVGGWILLENEVRPHGNEYSFFLVFKKLSERRQIFRVREFDPNSALVIRYGGFGDMLQASSVIAGLKQQGWNVVMNTTDSGKNILRMDPNISDWWMQDKEQVPNDQLETYWRALRSRFGKIVNLSESVECRFLVPYHRPESNFSPEILRHHCAGNYNDYACDLAGIPRKNQLRFYPTADERAWAKSQRKKLGDVPVILWSLSGSSLHKAYPWTDNVIATLMLHSNAKVVMVGDNLCKLLEDGWVDEPRVIRRSGEWSIRETLSFARVADIVVGPETGVLNSVSMEADVGKVLMLSHSTEENLTRDWLNTHVLTPNVDCYPCHRLHYDFSYCRRDEETHGAACAVSIKPEDVHEAIDRLLNARGFT